MLWEDILKGVLEGLGIGAGLYLCNLAKDLKDTHKIYKWLADSEKEFLWRSTRTISSYCNISENRVRELCSASTKISFDVKNKEVELWGITSKVRKDKKSN